MGNIGTYVGFVRVGRFSKKKIHDFIDICKEYGLEVSDIYVYKSGLLSKTYGLTVRGNYYCIIAVRNYVNEYF